MSSIEKTISTALVGTGHHHLEQTQTNTPLDPILNQVTAETDDQAHQLLTHVGSLTLYEEIGQQTDIKLPPPHTGLAPENHQQSLPAEAAALLTELCLQNEQFVLSQLLAGVRQRGWHVPLDLWPNLFKMGQKHMGFRIPIINACDDLSRWLAQQNEDWHYALWPEKSWAEIQDIFHNSQPPTRLALLRWYRQHDPAKGRQLLQTCWQAITATQRSQLLNILKDELSAEDEPFLEMALDDRQLTARRKAQELLSGLPDAQLGQRMIEHGRHFMRWTPRQKKPLTVTKPDVHSNRMKRDGIPPRSEKKETAYLSNRITNIVSYTPLDYWSTEIADDIPHFLELVSLSNWTRTLINGLVKATTQQNRPDWAYALINWGLHGRYEKLTLRNTHLLTPNAFNNLVTISIEEADQIEPLNSNGRLSHLLRSWKQPWPEPAAQQILGQITLYLKNQPPERLPDTTLKSAIRQFFSHAPLSLTPKIQHQLGHRLGLHPQWQVTIDKGCKIIEQRQRMAVIFETNE